MTTVTLGPPSRALGVAFAAALVGCAPAEPEPVERPATALRLHHVGLRTLDAEQAVQWYVGLWPEASEGSFAGRPAVLGEMALVFEEVAETPAGSFDVELGRPAEQSALWHIGAFVNTTGLQERLAPLGIEHLPLYTGPGDEDGVWRSGLTPYSGVLTREQLDVAEPAESRPGGFSYVLGPDGALFELTGGPNTEPALAHVHLFHEEPQCAANWYVDRLGMTLPPLRDEDGTTSVRPPYAPCEAPRGAPGWPSLERIGSVRAPRATVAHGSGSLSIYPRQCTAERCGADEPLVPTRGQVLDHVGFAVDDLDDWRVWLGQGGVVILEEVHAIAEGRGFMFEGPDALAIELVEIGG